MIWQHPRALKRPPLLECSRRPASRRPRGLPRRANRRRHPFSRPKQGNFFIVFLLVSGEKWTGRIAAFSAAVAVARRGNVRAGAGSVRQSAQILQIRGAGGAQKGNRRGCPPEHSQARRGAFFAQFTGAGSPPSAFARPAPRSPEAARGRIPQRRGARGGAAAAAQIPLGKPRRAATIRVAAPEGAFAAVLGETQARRPQVGIGSCPRDDDGVYCNIVFAGDDQECIKRAAGGFSAWLRENQVGHSAGG